MKFVLFGISMLAVNFGSTMALAQDIPVGNTRTASLACTSVVDPILGVQYAAEHVTRPSAPPEKSSIAFRVVTTVVRPGAQPQVHNLEQGYQDKDTAIYETGKFKVTLSKATGTAYLLLNNDSVQKCDQVQLK